VSLASHQPFVSYSDGFSAEELGTGSRATLTPFDRAFLESAPTYDDSGIPLPSVAPPPAVLEPPRERRLVSLLLFVGITGTASALLGLAVLRLLGHVLFQ